jgi:hypothetical protein
MAATFNGPSAAWMTSRITSRCRVLRCAGVLDIGALRFTIREYHLQNEGLKRAEKRETRKDQTTEPCLRSFPTVH